MSESTLYHAVVDERDKARAERDAALAREAELQDEIRERHTERKELVARIAALTSPALPDPRIWCKVCNGNARDVPCAYPSENREGCLQRNDPRDAVVEQMPFFLAQFLAWAPELIPGSEASDRVQKVRNALRALGGAT